MTHIQEEKISTLKKCLDTYTTHHLDDRVLNLQGMSVSDYRKFINCLVATGGFKNYLEIGVWKGSTAISALYNNISKLENYWLIENWSEYDGESAKKDFDVSWKTIMENHPTNLIQSDSFSVDLEKNKIQGVDLYFYDGFHTRECQYRALEYYYSCVADVFVYLVDDWNHESVHNGTNDAIRDLNFKVRYTNTRDWHNGIGIFVLEK
jgi:hypothetical protein